MKQIYHVGECPLCKEYGRMEVIYNYSSGKCSVMCEECLLEFESVNDYINNINGRRNLYDNTNAADAKTADLEEIERSEWYPYIIDKV